MMFGKTVRRAAITLGLFLASISAWGVGNEVLPPGMITPIGDVLVRAGVKVRVRVASNAELGAYRYGGVVERDGYAVMGDGGRAVYVHASSACSISGGDGGSQVVDAAGTGCWNIDWRSVDDSATIELFAGAIGVYNSVYLTGGTADAQPAMQKALNTGRRVRLGGAAYRLGTCAIQTVPGQDISGINKNASALVVVPGQWTSTSACTGVIVNSPAVYATSRSNLPLYHDFMIYISQPEVTAASDMATTDTQRLNSLLQISCIDSRGSYTGTFTHLVLTACWRGIDLRGDVGNIDIDDVTGSNFYAGVDIDGALDTIRSHNYHNFYSHVTTNQAALISRSSTMILSGRVDGYNEDNALCTAALFCYKFYVGSTRTVANDGYLSPGGVTTGVLTGARCDTQPNCFNISGGAISWVGGTITATNGGVVSGGALVLDGLDTILVNSDRYFVVQSGGILSVTNNPRIVDQTGADQTFIYEQAGLLVFSNNVYVVNSSLAPAYTKPKIWVFGGQINAIGNMAQPLNASATQSLGSGFFRVDSDSPNIVFNNIAQGWTNVFPRELYGKYEIPQAGTATRGAYPTLGTVTSVFPCASNQGRSFIISDSQNAGFYAAAAGGGSGVAKITCDGANYRYF